jgi:hypothetical protein|mmetsp:Transcript_62516/g.185960  ORF Transcript_62516/g.185960 Transcript_62516/m.185960 type:complete len:174 (+) Transcript_62516:2260-2781(+)
MRSIIHLRCTTLFPLYWLGTLHESVHAFKSFGVNVTYSRVKRDDNQNLGATFYIECVGDDKITMEMAEKIKQKIISTADPEVGLQVRVRPLVGRPKSRSMGDIHTHVTPEQLETISKAAEENRAHTPVEPVKEGEVEDEANKGNGAGAGGRFTQYNRVAPAPNPEIEAVEADA